MVMFGIASALFSVAVLALIPDAIEGVRRRFSSNRSEEVLEDESEVVMVKEKKGKRKGERKGDNKSSLNKNMKKNEISDDEEIEDDHEVSLPKSSKVHNLKIKKVKAGRMI